MNYNPSYNENNFLSVRLMTYNQAAFIEEALRGIDEQKTDFNFEVVVGDDFSTDGTLDKIRKFHYTNPRLSLKILQRESGDEYWQQRKKKGRLYNFINILENCSGKYIALLDGDDFWTDPSKLQKQVDFLEENKSYGICFHNVVILEQESGTIVSDYITRRVPEESNVEDLAEGNYIHTPSVVIRNNFVIPAWFTKTAMGDWTLYMLQVKNQKIWKFDEEMAVYRVHSGGIWATKSKEKRDQLTRMTVELIFRNGDLAPTIKAVLGSRIGIKKKISLLESICKKVTEKIRLGR